MDRLSDFQAFATIVEKGSLTAAAHQLGRSLQSVSRSLAALERDIGVALVQRTTRRSSPTEAGFAFYRRLSTALAEIEAAKLETANQGAEASGLLRFTGSNAFAPLYIVPALPAFLNAHPKVEIELNLSDSYVDLIGEGFDLAVRIGDLPDSSLKARRLANSRRVVFAAPSYFARHGRPRRPEDLAQHQCIVRTAARDGNAWPFKIDGRVKTVKVGGRFRTSSAPAANEAAVQGLGIANAALWQVRPLVDSGAVELVLTRFEPSPVPDPCRVAVDQSITGQDAIICRFPCRAAEGVGALAITPRGRQPRHRAQGTPTRSLSGGRVASLR
jgi:DNA-binding transcriptional LysR family regulator